MRHAGGLDDDQPPAGHAAAQGATVITGEPGRVTGFAGLPAPAGPAWVVPDRRGPADTRGRGGVLRGTQVPRLAELARAAVGGSAAPVPLVPGRTGTRPPGLADAGPARGFPGLTRVTVIAPKFSTSCKSCKKRTGHTGSVVATASIKTMANKKAADHFLALSKPSRPRMDSMTHYSNSVVPQVREKLNQADASDGICPRV